MATAYSPGLVLAESGTEVGTQLTRVFLAETSTGVFELSDTSPGDSALVYDGSSLITVDDDEEATGALTLALNSSRILTLFS